MAVVEEADLSVNVKWILFCSPGVIINVNTELPHKLCSLIHEPEHYNLFLGPLHQGPQAKSRTELNYITD